MNYTDFSQSGGFPLDVDVLDFNQKALAEASAWMEYQRGDKETIILSGCEDVNGSDEFFPGWLLVRLQNGKTEVVPFSGGLGNTQTTYEVFLHETRTPAAFQDGQSHDVLEVTRFVDFNSAGGTSLGLLDEFRRWEQVLGDRAVMEGIGAHWRESTFNSRLSSLIFQSPFDAFCSGEFCYRKNALSRLLHIRGSLEVTNAQNIGSSLASYHQTGIGHLPISFRPENYTGNLPAVATGTYQTGGASGGIITPTTINMWSQALLVTIVPAPLGGAGNVMISLPRPPAGIAAYTVSFNHSIPLD